MPTHTILENADSSGIYIGTTLYMTEDALGEFSAQDVVMRHENNIRGIKNREESISFPFKASPFWVVFEVRNNTNQEEWLLDFGSLSDGRAGMIAKLLVYEGKTRKIFFDGLRTNAANDNKVHFDTAIPVVVPRGKTSLFVLYVYPSDYRPLVFKPSLISTKYFLENQGGLGNQIIDNLFPIICLISAVLLFCALLLNGGLGFVPLIAYYIGFFLWFTLFERPIFAAFPGADSFPIIVMMVKTLLILTSAFLSAPRQEDTSTFKVLMYFAFAISLLTLCMVTIFLGQGTTLIRPLSVYLVSFLVLVIAMLFMVTHMNKFNRVAVIAMTVWIGLYLVGTTITLLSAAQILPHSAIIAHADLLIALPQLICIICGVVGAVKGSEKYKIHEVIKKAQKAQALLKARQTKEASDQSRLLRVIEREREIMEELRGREAERTEEMRKAKIAADEANNSKSAFLAVVSHEIRTPMTGIMGMVRLMEETDMTPEQREFAMTIKDSGDAMLALLNDILDFSKIEGGGMTLEIIDFDLMRVMNGVIMLMKGHADQKKISLILDVGPEIPHIFQGDPTRLRQIFLNLVGNALKFTSRGHVKITVRCDTDSPAHKPENNEYALYFAVEDTGIGISEEAQANLFTPFSQADSSISRKFGGTGLGLAICKRLIETMGGKIQLFSREGKGTTFYFTLALKSPVNAMLETDTTEQTQHIPSEPMHILIVDDNAINRKVIAGLLGRDGHSFDAADSAEAAIDLLKENKQYDIVFMDIELPGMNGVEATQVIRNELMMTNLPIVALTGNVSAEDKAAYQQAGLDYHLAKPINPDLLRDTIRTVHVKRAKSAPQNAPAPMEEKPFKIEDDNTDVPILNFELDDTDLPAEIEEPAPKAPTKTVRLIDEAMLKGLKDGLGSAQTKELLEGLFEKAYEIAPAMKESLEQGDHESLRMRAHELKGMAGNFGLSGLSDKAGFVEHALKDGNTIPLDDLIAPVDEIAVLIDRSKIAIEKYLD